MKLQFESDYMEGAHPKIVERLMETNLEKTTGYGLDEYTKGAKEKIRLACGCPEAEVYFLTGGTQTNATIIDALLKSYAGVVAADSGHISLHEAGAIEHSGHKVLTIPNREGKLSAESLSAYLAEYHQDANKEHMVYPGMVYLSFPTEYGTLYSARELADLYKICQDYRIPLFIDGARLGYGLTAPGNDLTLPELARLCDVFYIGGTKVGALFGEAVVIPNPGLIPHFFTMIKQHGALLAKGRILGIQFDTLFTDNLYFDISAHAIKMAEKMKQIFMEKGYSFYINSPTNQVFVILSNDQVQKLSAKVTFSFWQKAGETSMVVRFATSWATREEDLEKLKELL